MSNVDLLMETLKWLETISYDGSDKNDRRKQPSSSKGFKPASDASSGQSIVIDSIPLECMRYCLKRWRKWVQNRTICNVSFDSSHKQFTIGHSMQLERLPAWQSFILLSKHLKRWNRYIKSRLVLEKRISNLKPKRAIISHRKVHSMFVYWKLRCRMRRKTKLASFKYWLRRRSQLRPALKIFRALRKAIIRRALVVWRRRARWPTVLSHRTTYSIKHALLKLLTFAYNRKSNHKRMKHLSLINKRRRFITWKSFTSTTSLQHYIYKSAADYNRSHLLEHAFGYLQVFKESKRRFKNQKLNKNADKKLKQRWLILWKTRCETRTFIKSLADCREYNLHRMIQQWRRWLNRRPKSLKLKIELFHKQKIFLMFYNLLHTKHLRHRNFQNALKLSKTQLFRQWTQQLFKLKANHDFHNRWKSRCYYKLLIRVLHRLRAKVQFLHQMDHMVLTHQTGLVMKQWFQRTQKLQLQHYSLQRGELRFQVSKVTLALQRWNYHLGKDLLLTRKYAVFRKLHPYPRCSFVATVFYHWRYEIVELARLWRKFSFLKARQRNKIMTKNTFVNWQNLFDLKLINRINTRNAFKRWLKKSRLRIQIAETLAYQVSQNYHQNKGRKSDGSLSLPQFLLRLFYYRSLLSVVSILKSRLMSRKAIFIQRCYTRRIFQFWYLRVVARSRQLVIMQQLKSKAGEVTAFHAHCLQTIASKRFQSTALRTFKTWKNEFFRQSQAAEKIMLNTQGRLFLHRWMRLYNFHAMQNNLNIGSSNNSNNKRNRVIYKLIGDMSYVDLKSSKSEILVAPTTKPHHSGRNIHDETGRHRQDEDSLVMSDISVSHAGSIIKKHHHKPIISRAAIRTRSNNRSKASSTTSVNVTEQENSRSLNNSAMMQDVISFNIKERSYLMKFQHSKEVVDR